MSRFDVHQFVSIPDQELKCSVCMNVLDEPKETPCRHVFCYACIRQALETKSRCPVCRRRLKESDLRPILPLVKNIIDKLEMRCLYYREGKDGVSCPKIVKKEFYLRHIENCVFKYEACGNTGCVAQILLKDSEVHKRACKFRYATCDKGCDLLIMWKNRGSHNCLEALKKCNKDLQEKVMHLHNKVISLENATSLAQAEDDPFVSTDASYRLRPWFPSSVAINSEHFDTEDNEREGGFANTRYFRPLTSDGFPEGLHDFWRNRAIEGANQWPSMYRLSFSGTSERTASTTTGESSSTSAHAINSSVLTSTSPAAQVTSSYAGSVSRRNVTTVASTSISNTLTTSAVVASRLCTSYGPVVVDVHEEDIPANFGVGAQREIDGSTETGGTTNVGACLTLNIVNADTEIDGDLPDDGPEELDDGQENRLLYGEEDYGDGYQPLVGDRIGDESQAADENEDDPYYNYGEDYDSYPDGVEDNLEEELDNNNDDDDDYNPDNDEGGGVVNDNNDVENHGRDNIDNDDRRSNENDSPSDDYDSETGSSYSSGDIVRDAMYYSETLLPTGSENSSESDQSGRQPYRSSRDPWSREVHSTSSHHRRERPRSYRSRSRTRGDTSGPTQDSRRRRRAESSNRAHSDSKRLRVAERSSAAANSSEGAAGWFSSRRSSARLQGLEATPPIISEVYVPPTAAELLERYTGRDGEDESDDPSWEWDGC